MYVLQCIMMNIKTRQVSGRKGQLFLFQRGVWEEKRIQPEAGKIKNRSLFTFSSGYIPSCTYLSTQYPQMYISFNHFPHEYISFHPIPSCVNILQSNTLMGTYPSTQYPQMYISFNHFPHEYITFHKIPSWVHILPPNTLMGIYMRNKYIEAP